MAVNDLRNRRFVIGVLCGVLAGLLTACIPVFVDGVFQSLNFTFKFDQALAADEETLVHIAVFPQKVKLKKRFVRLSGEIVPAKSGTVPGRLTVRAEVENPNTGKVTQSLSVKLDIQEDGRFEGSGQTRSGSRFAHYQTARIRLNDA